MSLEYYILSDLPDTYSFIHLQLYAHVSLCVKKYLIKNGSRYTKLMCQNVLELIFLLYV